MGLESCLPGKKETGGGKLPFRTFGGEGRGDWGGKSDLEGKGVVGPSSWFKAESPCHPPLPNSWVLREEEPGGGSLLPRKGEQRGLF